MKPARDHFLVEPSWLAEHLHDPEVRVVDMRGYVRLVPRAGASDMHDAVYTGAYDEYEQEHIPGAVYLDWTHDIAHAERDVEAQIVPPDAFKEALERVGIGDEHLIVAYDNHPASQFATRLWWSVQYYGHSRVVVLNGGLARWKREHRPLTDHLPTYPRASFSINVQPQMRATAEDVLAMLRRGDSALIDARDAGQYTGAIARGSGRRGHIPGALSLPREELIDPATGTFRSDEELQQIFDRVHVTPDQHVVAYCNGGIAATTVLFSLAMLGYSDLTNYDGSWNEWGVRQDLPVELVQA